MAAQVVTHAALCSLACRMVSSVSRFDHRSGSKAEHATALVSTEAVVVAQPGRISNGSGSSAARIARLANEVEGIGGGLRDGFRPTGALRLPLSRQFDEGRAEHPVRNWREQAATTFGAAEEALKEAFRGRPVLAIAGLAVAAVLLIQFLD